MDNNSSHQRNIRSSRTTKCAVTASAEFPRHAEVLQPRNMREGTSGSFMSARKHTLLLVE